MLTTWILRYHTLFSIVIHKNIYKRGLTLDFPLRGLGEHALFPPFLPFALHDRPCSLGTDILIIWASGKHESGKPIVQFCYAEREALLQTAAKSHNLLRLQQDEPCF